MMQMVFSEQEYERVRAWLLSAFDASPAVFDEAEMLEKLRKNEWYLVTADRSACVLELCKYEDEWIANVLLLGGEKNNSLKEIMRCQITLCRFLKDQGFTKLVGQPRKEFHKLILKHGFEKKEEEFIKRL
ncbi:hypothetical protein [Agrobacterium rosae]|uniref:Uncharacterized protein n=1 Tax=Agrobacterium rosae TaxID=1972867 RepID=A0AAE5RTP0_9HYPH|nr:hypothetical protein [Agrobacterium rosae]KAA3511613.1 hypothetical protein DXM21_14305 [Agrobacterium rosae]KAA3518963.1 hypothetical protein DXM25_13710 [Agrobacterium rosae]MQB49310.1 hypothetical protein [Agrobacterium rosae]POO49151.1 hypothetical protein CPJ18_22130 [Agrobacterium rosae]